jgi:hypothetical protein
MFEIDLFDKHIRKFLLLAMLIRRCLLYDYQVSTIDNSRENDGGASEVET